MAKKQSKKKLPEGVFKSSKDKMPEDVFEGEVVSWKDKILAVFQDMAESLKRPSNTTVTAPDVTVNISEKDPWTEIKVTPVRDSKGIAINYTIRKVQ